MKELTKYSRLFNNHWKNRFNIPETKKEEESVRKKTLEVDGNLNWKQKKFLCNSDFKKQIEKSRFQIIYVMSDFVTTVSNGGFEVASTTIPSI